MKTMEETPDKYEQLAMDIAAEVQRLNSDVGFDTYSMEVGAHALIEKIVDGDENVLDILGVHDVTDAKIHAAAKALAARDGYSLATADHAIVAKYTKDAKVALEAARDL